MSTRFDDASIDRRIERGERRRSEIERIDKIDQLADRLLNDPKYDDTPATEVWDIAAEMFDAREQA